MEVEIVAIVTGSVAQVHVALGAEIEAEEVVVVLESMKMEIPVVSDWAARVVGVRVAPGDNVREGDVLVIVERR